MTEQSNTKSVASGKPEAAVNNKERTGSAEAKRGWASHLKRERRLALGAGAIVAALALSAAGAWTWMTSYSEAPPPLDSARERENKIKESDKALQEKMRADLDKRVVPPQSNLGEAPKNLGLKRPTPLPGKGVVIEARKKNMPAEIIVSKETAPTKDMLEAIAKQHGGVAPLVVDDNGIGTLEDGTKVKIIDMPSPRGDQAKASEDMLKAKALEERSKKERENFEKENGNKKTMDGGGVKYVESGK